MIRINDHLSLDEGEITESFIRSSGPGGQNVNKLATAVQLRFDVRHSPSLPHEVRGRLERLAGKRLTRDGVLVITAQRHRTQERNREDALDRLVELVRAAAVRPTPRRPTRPTLGSKVRRLEGKKRRSDIKAGRQGKPSFEFVARVERSETRGRPRSKNLWPRISLTLNPVLRARAGVAIRASRRRSPLPMMASRNP